MDLELPPSKFPGDSIDRSVIEREEKVVGANNVRLLSSLRRKIQKLERRNDHE